MATIVRKNNESGAALIVVLGVLALLAVLAASVVMISKTSASVASVSYDFIQSTYKAEGVSARVRWQIMQERSGAVPEDEKEFKALGYFKTVDYYGSQMRVAVYDMNAGLTLTGSTNDVEKTFSYLKQNDDNESQSQDVVDELVDKIIDYLDRDDLLRISGAEKADYTSADLQPLPRNDKFQYREELCWIPGFAEFYSQDELGRLKDFNIVSASRELRKRKPSLTSSSLALIKSKLNLQPTEVEALEIAFNELHNSGTPLEETLDPLLLSKVKQMFETRESGYYTLVIRAPEEEIGKTYAVSLKINQSIPSSGVKYYEHTIY